VLLSDAMAQPTTRTKGVVRADRDVPAVRQDLDALSGSGPAGGTCVWLARNSGTCPQAQTRAFPQFKTLDLSAGPWHDQSLELFPVRR